MKKHPPYAIVHIGSIRTSIVIVSYKSLDSVEVLESAQKETTFGEEIFRTHRLSFASINELCHILVGFRQLLLDYGVAEVFPIATTVIREAENNVGILDLLRLRTGFSFHVADMSEEIYYKFFALHNRMLREKAPFIKEPLLLLDVNSGGLGFTGWKNGRLIFQTNVAGGRISVLEHFTPKERSALSFPSAVRDYFHAALSTLWPDIREKKIRTLILSGFEARMLSSLLAPNVETFPIHIAPDDLVHLVDTLVPLTVKKLMINFNLSERRASLLLPTLLLYDEIIRIAPIEKVIVYDLTFSTSYAGWCGARLYDPHIINGQTELQMDLARTVAKRYGGGSEHDQRVESFASVIFDALKKVYGLSERLRLLLRMSALLHETGKYVNLRNYPLYSWQIIRGTDLFGITESEKTCIAAICYYYSKENPDRKSVHYEMLSREQKSITDKCCAVLRLADALDRGHSGKIENISVTIKQENLLVTYRSEEDISLIRWSFLRASELFQEIFGIVPVLKRK